MMRMVERKTTIFCGYIFLQEVGLVFYKKQGLSLVRTRSRVQIPLSAPFTEHRKNFGVPFLSLQLFRGKNQGLGMMTRPSFIRSSRRPVNRRAHTFARFPLLCTQPFHDRSSAPDPSTLSSSTTGRDRHFLDTRIDGMRNFFPCDLFE